MHINITLNQDKSLSITGTLEIFDRNRRLNRWIKKFEPSYNQNEIFIKENTFKEDSQLYQFKKSIQKKINQNIKIDFNDFYIQTIAEFQKSEENFIDFSKQAKNIWNNIFDEKDFEYFCNTIKNKMSRTLYELQLRSAYHMAFSQNTCNFSVPGSGKTSIVYGAYAFLSSLKKIDPKFVNKIFVIGPSSSFGPWEEEYKKNFGKSVNSIRLTAEIDIQDKKNTLMSTANKNCELYLITYNSASTLEKYIKIFLKTHKVMLVCDEAHKFKRFDGIWSASVLKFSEYAKSKIVLTGTPCPNGYEDLYNLFKFLYMRRNVIGYRYDHLKYLTENPNHGDINNVLKNIEPFFTRIKKSDLNLPPFKDLDIINNKLNILEQKVYEKLKNELVSNSDLTAFSLLHRLVQSSNNLHLINNALNREEYDSEVDLESILGDELYTEIKKLDQLEYIPSKFETILPTIIDLVNKKQKILIWGIHIDTIHRFDSFLKSHGLKGCVITGQISNESDEFGITEREKLIKKFKTNTETNYIITNPTVLGESVSLHKVCHNAIYLERDYSAAPYIQSRDRIHRVWLDDNLNQINYDTFYYHVVSECTIDEKMYNRVNVKFKRMLELIENDIPLFKDFENIEQMRELLIRDIIDEYNEQN